MPPRRRQSPTPLKPQWTVTPRTWLGLAWLSCGLVTGRAEPVSFSSDIAPVLQAQCVTCHGPEETKGGYRLDSYERMQQSGDSETAPIQAGNPEASLLFQLLTSQDAEDRMPQKSDPLPQGVIDQIRSWIREGARFDGENPAADLVELTRPPMYPDPPARYPRPAPVLALTFHPSGEELASSGFHEVLIWNATNGALRRRLSRQPPRVQTLDYHPDGALLAVGGGAPGQFGELRLIDPADGSFQSIMVRARDVILKARFSRTGGWLACGGADQIARVFATTNRVARHLFDQHSDWVMDVDFSPDETQLVTACRDGAVRLFNLRTGALEETYLEHGKPVFSARFTEDGLHVLSGGADQEIHYWKTEEAKKIREIKGLSGPPYALVLLGSKVVTGGEDGEVRTYSFDPESKLIGALRGHKDVVYTISAHAPTERLAAGCYDGEVRLWNLGAGEELTHFAASPP